MAFAYVDDHRFLLYRGGTYAGDITPSVGDPAARDVMDALSVELTFRVIRNDLRDKLMPWPGIRPGDKLRVVNHDLEVFSGVIRSVGLDGSIEANDMGWYLSKSQIILQVSNAAAHDAIRKMCAKAGIPCGTIPALPTRITQVWVGSTPADILQDILTECAAETGTRYKCRIMGGKLHVTPLPITPIVAYHKPAQNLAAFDITLAKGEIIGVDSMDDLYNSVLLAREKGCSAQVLAQARNEDSVNSFGLQQLVERLSGDENTAQARQRVKNLLDQHDRLTVERQVGELWEADEVTSGALLMFQTNAYGVTGLQRVTEVTHHYAKRTMSLTVQDPAAGRAAGNDDTITV